MSAPAGLARFGWIWLAELISVIGSSLTAFVLSVWVYEQTGSETRFAVTMLCSTLPGILAGPVAGSVADRFDRRRVLIAADCGAALCTVLLAVLVSAGELAVWHVYAVTAVTAVCGTFHLTVHQALTPALIPRRHLGRANGLMQTAWGLQIAAPVVAGALLVTVGVRGVLLIDLATFAVATVTVLLVRLPRSATRPDGAAERPAPVADLAFGLTWLRRRRGLWHLLLVFAAFNFLFGVAGVLIRPLILSFSSPATLGALVFAGGCGIFTGSLVMGAWGGPRRRVRGICLFMALGGGALALHAPRPSVALIAVAAPTFLFTLPVVNGTVMTILQSATDPAAMGRVLAAARTLGQCAMPLAYMTAGPLAEHVTEPLMSPGGPGAGLGPLVGTGPGRGIALLFLVCGALMIALAVVARALPSLRDLEARPDPGHRTDPVVTTA
ncbi:Predicted arabinose efflux permease, MFS family [Thermomonospora echinospora]|uniref:Predicted arabinose efflux permease, MFS family n=1 Tax=Thermomonospora echinospora TaxID=1992 RepID=A0A1H5XH38_9ACTN|nr:MFS transporter [Thermomonospora echinospora]SEG10785.1 Predicted arabinose efflux permease, MFS family [Thermomonospora echinospora]